VLDETLGFGGFREQRAREAKLGSYEVIEQIDIEFPRPTAQRFSAIYVLPPPILCDMTATFHRRDFRNGSIAPF
jgi:hypothetical protein